MQWKAAASIVLLGLFAGQALAVPIFIDASGREWLDPNATLFRSWDDTASVCDQLSGDCSGILATHAAFSSDVDVTGYHWASRDEVRELFYEVAGLPPGALDGYSAAFPTGAGFGAATFGILDPTIQFDLGIGTENILNGLTRNVYLGPDLALHGVSGIVDNSPLGSDRFTLDQGLRTDIREASMGVFLYKAVPEPGTLALFAAALGGLFWLRARPARSGV